MSPCYRFHLWALRSLILVLVGHPILNDHVYSRSIAEMFFAMGGGTDVSVKSKMSKTDLDRSSTSRRRARTESASGAGRLPAIMTPSIYDQFLAFKSAWSNRSNNTVPKDDRSAQIEHADELVPETRDSPNISRQCCPECGQILRPLPTASDPLGLDLHALRYTFHTKGWRFESAMPPWISEDARRAWEQIVLHNA